MSQLFYKRAECYALLAAAMNGTVGTLTRYGLSVGASHHQVAFWKSFIAFLVLLTYSLLVPSERKALCQLRHKSPQFIVLAFFGIFCVYFFETWAFRHAAIPLVSFLTYAAGGITLILSSLFLRERLGRSRVLSFLLIVIGVYFLFSFEGHLPGSQAGILLSLVAGLGYALFIFLSKLMRIGGGVAVLVWLFGFGSLYLAIPLHLEGFEFPPVMALAAIGALVLLPSIGGFYFTTRALEKGEASSVQIIETSDPLFSTLFAFFIFGEVMGRFGAVGAAFIMAGLVVSLLRLREPVLTSP